MICIVRICIIGIGGGSCGDIHCFTIATNITIVSFNYMFVKACRAS